VFPLLYVYLLLKAHNNVIITPIRVQAFLQCIQHVNVILYLFDNHGTMEMFKYIFKSNIRIVVIDRLVFMSQLKLYKLVSDPIVCC
jgi:hypothetical protein